MMTDGFDPKTKLLKTADKTSGQFASEGIEGNMQKRKKEKEKENAVNLS